MKILLTMNLPYTRAHGGANKSNRGLCTGLVEAGHAVRVVVPTLATPSPVTREQVLSELADQGVRVRSVDGADIFTLDGVEVHAVADPSRLRAHFVQQLKEFGPDWALVSSEDPSQTLLEAALKQCPRRVVYLAHTPPLYPFGPESLYPGEKRTALVRQAAAVVPISKYAAGYIEKWSGIKATPIHFPHFGSGPFPLLARFDNPYILLINACVVKGLPIFLALARAFPDVAFAALPGYGTTEADRADIAAHPNVTLLENRKDIDDIFRQTRILLMPSLWVESFGMAVIDSMLRGIPVLSSNFGGLLEAKQGTDYLLPVRPIERFEEQLGENMLPIPIVPDQDITPWIEALGGLLSDRALYERQSAAAREAALKFVTGLSAAPFVELLNRLADKQAVEPTKPGIVSKAEQSTSVKAGDGGGDLDNLTPQQRALLVRMLKKKAEGRTDREPNLAPPITRCSRDGVLPLSFAQQRLWFLDQLTPGRAMFNIPTTVRLTGALNVSALERVLAEVTRRHEALRTNFSAREGLPFQVIHEPSPFAIPLTDLTSLAEPDRLPEALRLAGIETQTPFDLEHDSLIRARLFRLSMQDHMLVLTLHHIVSDGWSMGILVSEITALYAAFRAGLPSPLPEPEIQYADFAVWQRNWLQGAALDRQLAYWKEQLAGLPTLELPSDRPRPPVQRFQGASEGFRLSGELVDALNDLSRRDGATLFMALLAGWQFLLSRYCGQEDIPVGTMIANRNRRETEGVIGFFTNTLVLRTDLSGDPAFRELLGRVRDKTLGAYGYQDVPFEKLVEELQPERDPSRHPLFQVMVILSGASARESASGANAAATPSAGQSPSADAGQGRLSVSQMEAKIEGAPFDIELSMEESAAGLGGSVVYNTDMFEADTIARMLGHYQVVLRAIAANPASKLSELPYLTDSESRQILVEWNASRRAIPAARRIHQLFEDRVARQPNAIAVVCEGQTLTYAQLDARSNQLAHYLREQGVGPDILVGVCLAKSLEMAVALLAVLKAGGAYVPLDPAYPAQRLAYLMSDANLSLLITTEALAVRLREHQTSRLNPSGPGAMAVALDSYAATDQPTPTLCLDTEWPAIDRQPTTRPAVEVHPENLVYVIYTSGSTGQPKGAAVRHGGFTNLVDWFLSEFSMDDQTRTLLVSSLSFDLTQKNIFATLIAGGQLHLASSEHFDPARINATIQREKITSLNWTPSAFYPLLAECEGRGFEPLSSLRHVFLGGEPISMSAIQGCLESAAFGATIVNSYGPTECTDVVAYHRIKPRMAPDSQAPLGKAVPNVQLFILDKGLRPVAVGIPGELYIGGVCVGRGYVNRPAQTAERFLPNPFSNEPGERLYRTGDLVRWRSGGDIEFLGRIDHQVKIRGFRIELGEIEAALQSQPQVNESVVIVREDEPGDQRLVAYIAAPEATAETLRSRLEDRLPAYMIPSAFVFLEALPLSPNGKIDRKALPAPDYGLSETGDDDDAPRTVAEELVAQIWSDLLRVERVGRGDNFFTLGGHSLLATQVASRIRSAFQIEMPLAVLFESSTLADLADRVDTMQRESAGLLAPPITRCSREDALPLSFAQQRLWFIDQLEPGISVYNVPAAVKLIGPFNTDALTATFNEIVRRHEVLRTTFSAVDGQPVQIVHPYEPFPLAVTSLEHLPESERDAMAQRLAHEEADCSFDLETGPMIRVSLLRLGGEEIVVLLTMHHIVSDGWSMGLLIQEVGALYAAYSANRPSPLPELPIQYADFAVWQRDWLQGPVLDKQLAYWAANLADLTALELPADRARPAVQSHGGAAVGFWLPGDAARSLKELSRREGATSFMTLLGAWQVLLARYSGQDDIVVGSPIAGRNRAETEDLIGFFVNTLVLRADLSGNPSFTESLRRVREACIGAYGHQDIPFEQLVESVAPVRDLSRHPLFQVMLVLQNAPGGGGVASREVALRPIDTERYVANFDLVFNLTETRDGVAGNIEYATDLFDADTIARMADHYVNLLTAIAGDPGRCLADLPLLTVSERHQLVVDWNATATDYPQGRLLHEWIADQAGRTPTATALIFNGLSLTYSDLDARANQLAHALQKRGVGPDTLVGICMERSLEMVVGLLGILKAGGAYVPIDPGYPAERIAYMLEDSQAAVVLTQERFAGMLSGLRNTPLNPPFERGEGREDSGINPQGFLAPPPSEGGGWGEVPKGLEVPESTPLNPPFRKGGGQERYPHFHEGGKEGLRGGSFLLPLLSEGGGWGEVGQVLCLDSDSISHEPVTAPSVSVQPNGLAYMIYTSGSTGKPKGAMNTHAAIVNRLLWMQSEYQLTSADRVLQKTPFSFDVSVWEFFWPLMTGATLVIAEPGGHQDSAYLVRTIKDQRITTLHFVPSMLQVFLDDPKSGECTGLKRIICSGEALPLDLQNRCLVVLPAGLHNLYGPTEAAVDVTFWSCKNDPDLRTVPIGHPIANTQIYILDNQLQPTPVGVPGELHIGGVNLARGYWGRPDLTADKFIPNPHGAEPGARLYKTADLARFRRDGSIEYLGRLDHQVKIRGFRIELGEIEAVLSQQPGIRDAVVLAREDTPGDKRLAAYLVMAGGEAAPAASDLRGALLKQLPEYMVPAAFVFLESLPLSPNGKLDRKALPAPDGARPELIDQYVAPSNPVEEAVAEMWSDILRVERVGITDNFFELGGHSLLLTRLASRIRRDIGVELPLRVLFDTPTVIEMVQAIAEQGEQMAEPHPLIPVSRDGALPLSFAQQRLWFIDQFDPGSSAYNIPSAVKLTGPLNTEALERTFNEIVRRHEVLRTTFSLADGEPVQVIHAYEHFPLTLTSLEHLSPPERDSRAEQLAYEEARRPFDLAEGPLLRSGVLRLGVREHVVLLTMHHIASDGWSMELLHKEIAALYSAFSADRPSPLPGLPIQYADFAVWQRNWLQGEVLDQQLAYWTEQLSGLPVLELPVDHRRPPVPTARGAAADFHLSAEATLALNELSRREGGTLFMALLAAWQLFLSRYSGQDDIVVGTPIAGRNRAETEELIGFFVNTLVMRGDLSGNPSFTELLRRMRAMSLAAYSHQDMPFERLVETLAPERDMSRHPLFQVMFQWENTASGPSTARDVTFQHIHTGYRMSKFDMTLYVAETRDGSYGTIEYAADLFEPATVERMAGHLRNLLEAIAVDPEMRIGSLPLLSAAERRQLIGEFNPGGIEYPVTLCAHQGFERQTARTPDAAAVVFEDQVLTYSELNARANQLAHHLQGLGVGPEVCVGLLVERSPDMVVGLLGILKAGGAYVPLDPEYPAERIAYILADSGVRVLLTQERFAGMLAGLHSTPLNPPFRKGGGQEGLRGSSFLLPLLSEGGGWGEVGQVLCLDSDWPLISREPVSDPSSSVASQNLAYVIYTSGSTGRPKGSLIPHGNIMRLFSATERQFQFGPKDVWTLFHSIAFDFSVWEVWGPLLHGGALHIVPFLVSRTPQDFWRMVVERQVTVLNQTPSAFHMLQEAALEQPVENLALRAVIFGGEALDLSSLSGWISDPNLAAVSLVNMYGITETTVHVTYCALTASDIAEGAGSLIGRAIDDLSLYVLDRYDQLAPIGVPGELYVGGTGLARGYLNRPGLTAERFVPNPFSAKPGDLLYRTGDLVRLLPDGDLEYHGRVDEQVKIRGFRIELGEIEASLAHHPSVGAAVTMVREDEPDTKRIVAYLVASAEEQIIVSDLRTFLRTRLPEYMTPSAFVVLDSLPLTANGKVDRKALPAPDGASGASAEYVAARTPTEEILSGIWRTVLRVDTVGGNDNFFALGGHSLLATQVASRIRNAFLIELPLQVLFEEPTLAGLAGRVDAIQRESAGVVSPAISRVSRDEPPPLSFAQQRLWFIDQFEPGNTAYNIASAVRLAGPLNTDALERTFNEIIRRHEVLRTTFRMADGRPPVQIIHPYEPAPLAITSLGHLPPPERAARVQQLVDEEARRPFNLEAGPLMRSGVLRLADQEHVVLLTMHHVISDGWSMGLLVKEIGVLYAAFSANEPSPLPELPIQYADFAVWQRQWLQGDVLDKQLAYWRGQLAGLPALELPTDQPRPPVWSHRWGGEGFHIPGEVAQSLKEMSRREGCTLFMTLLAGWHVLLSRYSGQDDVVVGSPIAGRNRAETENLIGFFLNVLLLRGDLAGNPSFTALLGRARKACLGAYGHQDIPFEQLVETLSPPRDPSRHPLFQVMIVLQNAAPGGGSAPQRTIAFDHIDAGEHVATFDLTLNVTETPDILAGTLEYAAALFDADTISRMAGHYVTLMTAIARDPARPLSDLPLLTDSERNQLLIDWNATVTDYPQGRLLHQFIEDQAARTPTSMALIFNGLSLTYREVDERANQLAHYLVKQGVGADTLVGICVERSVEMVVGLLGILKAGGAYVPLDPSYPKDRLAYMLADCRTPVLLTQERFAGMLGGLHSTPLNPPFRKEGGQERYPHFHEGGQEGLRGGSFLLPLLSEGGGWGEVGQVLCLDSDWPLISGEPTSAPSVSVQPNGLAYMIYTSGSTGKPKGAMNTHEAIINRLLWMQSEYQLTPADRVLQKTPFSFDVSVWEFFWPLMTGATLVVAEPGGHQDSAYLVRTIKDHRITTLHFVPSMLQVFLDDPKSGECTGLKRIICSGEALPVDLQDRCLAALPAGLHNLYGPTEAAVDVTYWSCHSDPELRSVPIGHPIANTQIYILDKQLQPVPIGVPGELHIGGANLARGYWGRPDLTADKFIPNSHSAEPGARLYKTADLARFRRDGRIEYLGRLDHQVKIRGFRIELGEIEAALAQQPGIREVAVLAREDAPGDKRLAAYLVAESGGTPPSASASAGELRGALQAHLPEYMVPSAFVFLDSFPLSPNGKLDRQALPAPDGARPELDSGFIAPRSPLEEELADFWRGLLRVERIGITDNFFELGGHSLLLTQLASRIRDAYSVEIPLRSLFDSPTIAGMSRLIADQQIGERDVSEVALMLKDLQNLSEEEIAALLAEMED